MLGSWEIAYIDYTHRELSKTGLGCSGTILESGVLFIDQEAAIGSCSCSGVNATFLDRTSSNPIFKASKPLIYSSILTL